MLAVSANPERLQKNNGTKPLSRISAQKRSTDTLLATIAGVYPRGRQVGLIALRKGRRKCQPSLCDWINLPSAA